SAPGPSSRILRWADALERQFRRRQRCLVPRADLTHRRAVLAGRQVQALGRAIRPRVPSLEPRPVAHHDLADRVAAALAHGVVVALDAPAQAHHSPRYRITAAPWR